LDTIYNRAKINNNSKNILTKNFLFSIHDNVTSYRLGTSTSVLFLLTPKLVKSNEKTFMHIEWFLFGMFDAKTQFYYFLNNQKSSICM